MEGRQKDWEGERVLAGPEKGMDPRGLLDGAPCGPLPASVGRGMLC